MEPQRRHQSQRASPPAALLNANQQAERPTLLLGDWERGHWLACLHWSPVSLTVSELTQVSSWQSPLSGPASVFRWNKTAVGAGGGTRERPTAAPTSIKPAQTPNQCLSIHAEKRPSHNYSSYWNGNYPLNESGAVPLKADFPCWEGNIFAAEWRPFRKRLIAIGRFIPCDIYENFMDGSCFRLWHFGFPLKVRMWWLFYSSHQDCKWKQQALGWRMALMKEGREKECVFILSGKVINTRWRSSPVWYGSSFHWLLTLLKC